MGHPVKVKATPAFLANEIISHNMTNEYTHTLVIGTSGSGKSTLIEMILHELHTRHPYQIHFFSKKEVLDLSNIIKKLKKRIDHIIIFDDISWLFKSMSPEQVEDLMHQLTIIRHEVKARVVSIFMIHYSYAILKALRQADFRIITSMTDEEKENFVKVFGNSNRPLINKYADDYRFQTLYHKFKLPHPDQSKQRDYEFVTKEPFKLALVSAMGKLRYMLFYKLPDQCPKCTPPSQKQLKPADIGFMNSLIKKYGPNRVKRMARLVSFINTGEGGLQHTDRIVYNQLQKFVSEYKVDLISLAEVLRDSKHVPSAERETFIIKGLQHLEEKTLTKKKVENIPKEELDVDVTDTTDDYLSDQDIADMNKDSTTSDESATSEDDDDDDPEPDMYGSNVDQSDDKDDDSMFSGVNFKFGDWGDDNG